jgi:hypothetical protein
MRPSWPAARRYLLARVLRVPARHLASLSESTDGFVTTCICGWRSNTHSHRADALVEAHVHTRYVQPVPNPKTEASVGQLAFAFEHDPTNTVEPIRLALVERVEPTGRDDPRASGRSW